MNGYSTPTAQNALALSWTHLPLQQELRIGDIISLCKTWKTRAVKVFQQAEMQRPPWYSSLFDERLLFFVSQML
jgi:hypothetical protein